MKLITIETISSKPDSFGNCYHACRATNLISGRVLEFTISGDNAKYAGHHIFGNWELAKELGNDREAVLSIRQFNSETKGWPYAGCTSQEIATYIQANGGMPSLWESLSAHCDENGIEIKSHYSDLYVPISPMVTKICAAYGKNRNNMSVFTDIISGKPSYDIPFAYHPYWDMKAKPPAQK